MFYQPKSIREALERKAELRESGAFIAGGTDIVVLMNAGKAAPENFIDLTHIKELTAISKHNGTLELAGNVTYAQAGRLPIRCLAQASLSVGGPGIRELGTIAGNLATASPAGDGSTALLALDAEVELTSARGARTMSLEKFFISYRKTALAPDEMITKVVIRRITKATGSRTASAAPSTFRWWRLPLRSRQRRKRASRSRPSRPFADALSQGGSRLREGRRENRQVAETVRSEIKPITDHRASADYKIHLAGVLVRRLLENLVKA